MQTALHAVPEINEAALACLERAGIRATSERVDALAMLMRHPGRVHNIRELLPQDHAAAASTRLYRALHVLEEQGIVAHEPMEVHGRAVFGYRFGKTNATASAARDKVRFQCRQCGQVALDSNPALHAKLAELGLCNPLANSSSDVMVLYTCSVCDAKS